VQTHGLYDIKSNSYSRPHPNSLLPRQSWSNYALDPPKVDNEKNVSPFYSLWHCSQLSPSRSWPGALDVTVGGGIGMGQSARDTIVRECVEEASLPASFVQAHARFVGFLPFPNRKPSGWILLGYYYLFEMELPSDGSVRPSVNPADERWIISS
jgi:hypothetical protein